ncbi:TetR/AcrR family transcriptional regulator [Nocardia coffeae]|uniref:TetR/AcrR family transcriptional regulator n=1 Tax=Nocardia coffeae TaxID=2873381 RepID=UPI0035565387
MHELGTPNTCLQRGIPRRGGILTAASRVLERSRFRSLKVRQVLAASGTSTTPLYRRFPSKAHLIFALPEHDVRHIDRQLQDRTDPIASVSEQLRTWLSYKIDIPYTTCSLTSTLWLCAHSAIDRPVHRSPLQKSFLEPSRRPQVGRSRAPTTLGDISREHRRSHPGGTAVVDHR